MLSFTWAIIIGFIAGVTAKFITPGERQPKGFILTTALGIIGALVATYVGQAIGWYHADQKAGFLGAIVGAVINPADIGIYRASTPRLVAMLVADAYGYDLKKP